VFENEVLWKIFGPNKDEVTEEWRRLHNEKLYDMYSTPNIIQWIKSRRVKWTIKVARMGDGSAYGVGGGGLRKGYTMKT
jgi:hypothetical protein